MMMMGMPGQGVDLRQALQVIQRLESVDVCSDEMIQAANEEAASIFAVFQQNQETGMKEVVTRFKQVGKGLVEEELPEEASQKEERILDLVRQLHQYIHVLTEVARLLEEEFSQASLFVGKVLKPIADDLQNRVMQAYLASVMINTAEGSEQEHQEDEEGEEEKTNESQETE